MRLKVKRSHDILDVILLKENLSVCKETPQRSIALTFVVGLLWGPSYLLLSPSMPVVSSQTFFNDVKSNDAIPWMTTLQ